MGWMRTVLSEVWGLFVDDGSLAVAIVVWVGLMWILERSIGAWSAAGGWVLFGGLGVILVESVVRFARGRRAG